MSTNVLLTCQVIEQALLPYVVVLHMLAQTG